MNPTRALVIGLLLGVGFAACAVSAFACGTPLAALAAWLNGCAIGSMIARVGADREGRRP